SALRQKPATKGGWRWAPMPARSRGTTAHAQGLDSLPAGELHRTLSTGRAASRATALQERRHRRSIFLEGYTEPLAEELLLEMHADRRADQEQRDPRR